MEGLLANARRDAALVTRCRDASHPLHALLEAESRAFIVSVRANYIRYLEASLSQSKVPSAEVAEVCEELVRFLQEYDSKWAPAAQLEVLCMALRYRRVDRADRLAIAVIGSFGTARPIPEKEEALAARALLSLQGLRDGQTISVPMVLLVLAREIFSQKSKETILKFVALLAEQLQTQDEEARETLLEWLADFRKSDDLAISDAAKHAILSATDFVIKLVDSSSGKEVSIAVVRSRVEPLLPYGELQGNQLTITAPEPTLALSDAVRWFNGARPQFDPARMLGILRVAEQMKLEHLSRSIQTEIVDHKGLMSTSDLIAALATVKATAVALFVRTCNYALGERFLSTLESALSQPKSVLEIWNAYSGWEGRNACFKRITIAHSSLWVRDMSEPALTSMLTLVEQYGESSELPEHIARIAVQNHWLGATIVYAKLRQGLADTTWQVIFHTWSPDEVLQLMRGAPIPGLASILSQSAKGEDSFLERFFSSREFVKEYHAQGGRITSASSRRCVICRALDSGPDDLVSFLCAMCQPGDLDFECDGDSRTPLIRALAMKKGSPFVKILLEAGASPTRKTARGTAPLPPSHIAELFEESHLAALASPLAFCAAFPDNALENTRTLLKFAPAQQDGDYVTPLMVASWFGLFPVVQALWEHGASTSTKCTAFRDFTAFDFALDSHQEDVLVFLLPKCAFLDVKEIALGKYPQFPKLVRAAVLVLQGRESMTFGPWHGHALVFFKTDHPQRILFLHAAEGIAMDLTVTSTQLLLESKHLLRHSRKVLELSDMLISPLQNDEPARITVMSDNCQATLQFETDEQCKSFASHLVRLGVATMSKTLAQHM